MPEQRTWMRGGLTLALVALVVAGLLAAPVTAAKKPATKTFVKKKVAAVQKALDAAEAGNQDKCTNGTVLAYMHGNTAPATAAFSGTGITDQFNCKGGAITMRDDSTVAQPGTVEIQIPGVTNAPNANDLVVLAMIDEGGCFIGCGAASDHVIAVYGDPSQTFLELRIADAAVDEDDGSGNDQDSGESIDGEFSLAVLAV